MTRNATIRGFLEGPLADSRGGSQSVRSAAESSFYESLSEDRSEPQSEPKKIREFLLRAERVSLFSYQREITEKIDAWLIGDQKNRSALVSLPTGGGKTRLGANVLIENFERKLFSRMLWVAPSAELIEQAVHAFEALWHSFRPTGGLSVSVNEIPRITKQADGQCSFVTAQLASKRIEAIETYSPEILVFDEAHQAVANTFRKVIRAQVKVGGKVLGLSATPGRAIDNEGQELSALFCNNLIAAGELGDDPVGTLRKKGVLARLETHLIDLPKRWEQIRVRNLSGRAMPLDELAAHPARFWSTVDAVKSLPKGSRALVFCASIAHCFSLMAALRDIGVQADTISHNASPRARRKILTRFATGDTDVLLNRSLLATGYDCPGITDVVLASPIRSPILWEQILGRASRGPAVGGTRIGRIWELDDHRKMHGQVMSYLRFLNELWK